MNKNVAIIGSGSGGVALANHLGEMQNKVKIWSFSQEEKDYINNKKSCLLLPGVKVNENVTCSNNIEEVVNNSDFILHVTPSKFTRNVFKEYKDYVLDKPIIICSKGLESSTLTTLDEVINHIPTAIILASKDQEILEEIPQIFSNEYMRVYKSTDVRGVEVGGAFKNIIAFCAGIIAELNLGSNAEAALITRGLAEIAILGTKMGSELSTFYGLSGLGDLILTCSSDESRNRTAGKLIAKGMTKEEVKNKIGLTIESFDNIEIAKRLLEKYDVDMPIVNAAFDVLNNNLSVKDAINMLMTRSLKFEND